MIKTSTKTTSSALSLLLSAALLFTPLAPVLRANDAPESARKRFLPTVPTNAAPIGTLESFGKTFIDGRLAQGRELLWGGELIQAPAEMGVRIQLEGAGQVTLARGSAARFATAKPRFEGNVLIAALERGEIKVALAPTATAYVEAGDEAFSATLGASFRLGLSESGTALNVLSGAVLPAPFGLAGKYLISRARPNPGTKFLGCQSGSVAQKEDKRTAKKSSDLDACIQEIRNAPSNPGRSGGPSINDSGNGSDEETTLQETKAAPGIPVTFTLSDNQLGSLSAPNSTVQGKEVTVITDQQGLARVAFQAGPKRYKGEYLVKACDPQDPKNNDLCNEARFPLEVAPSFFTPTKVLLAAGIIGAITVGIVVSKDKGGLAPVPPPKVTQ